MEVPQIIKLNSQWIKFFQLFYFAYVITNYIVLRGSFSQKREKKGKEKRKQRGKNKKPTEVLDPEQIPVFKVSGLLPTIKVVDGPCDAHCRELAEALVNCGEFRVQLLLPQMVNKCLQPSGIGDSTQPADTFTTNLSAPPSLTPLAGPPYRVSPTKAPPETRYGTRCSPSPAWPSTASTRP